MSTSENTTIECATHGTSTATYVCNHLTSGHQKGFNCGYDSQEPDEKWPDAWCDDCQTTLNDEGEWNETSATKADIQVVCASCYENLRQNNWLEDTKQFEKYQQKCEDYLAKKQKIFLQKFNINTYEKWNCYQEQSKLVFSHNNVKQVEAHISFVGSYMTESKSWVWAWADQLLPSEIKQECRKIRAIGDSKRYLKLASATFTSDEEKSWSMTAIMAKELKAIGAYRISFNEGYRDMIVHEANWLNKDKTPNLLTRLYHKINR